MKTVTQKIISIALLIFVVGCSTAPRSESFIGELREHVGVNLQKTPSTYEPKSLSLKQTLVTPIDQECHLQLIAHGN